MSMSQPLGLPSRPTADDCKLCITYRLRTLAATLGEDSSNVARRLGLQRQSICWIEHIHEHDSDLSETAFHLLHSCAAQKESTFVERLTQALREEGREDLLAMMTCKCSLRGSNQKGVSKTGCCCAGKCAIL